MKNGEVIIATNYSKEKLRKMRKDASFYCPQCKGSVHLKVGEFVVPHFAHEKENTCLSLFSEGESIAHLLGKQQLYDLLEKETESVTLEPYLSALAQRPDLLVKQGSERIPIEFQCSRISVQQKVKRTNGYIKVGLNPIWILQTPKKYRERSPSVHLFSFSRFEESFFKYQTPEGNVLLTYDPQLKKFHYFSSLLHVVGNQYIGTHRMLSLEHQSFPFARPKIPTAGDLKEYLKVYAHKRRQLLKSRIFLNRRGINDLFLRACYELRIEPVNLPLWIGLPVLSHRTFAEHACVWQLLLIRFMKLHNINFRGLTKDKIRMFISSMASPSSEKIQACLQYRNLFLANGIENPSRSFSFDTDILIEHLKGAIVAKG